MFVYHNAPIGTYEHLTIFTIVAFMIHEHLKTFPIGRYDILTSNNLLYRDAIVHENLTISPPIEKVIRS
jgi:hypothetical protein